MRNSILMIVALLVILGCKSKSKPPEKPGKTETLEQAPMKPEEVNSSSSLGSYARSLSLKIEGVAAGTGQYNQGYEKAKQDIFQQWQRVKNSSSYDSEFAKSMLALVENVRSSTSGDDYKLGYFRSISEFYDVSIYKPTSISALSSLLNRYVQELKEVTTTSSNFEEGAKLGKKKSEETWAALKTDSNGTQKFIEKIAQFAEETFLGGNDNSYKAGVMRGVSENMGITSTVVDPVSVANEAKTEAKFEELLKKLQNSLVGVDKDSDAYKKAVTDAKTIVTKVWGGVNNSTNSSKEEQFYINTFKEIEKVNQEQNDHSYRSGFFNAVIIEAKSVKAKEIDNLNPDYGRWTQAEYDSTRKTCWESALKTNPNLASSQAYVLCTCVVQESAKRWEYDDYLRNESWYANILDDDGVIDQCRNKL